MRTPLTMVKVSPVSLTDLAESRALRRMASGRLVSLAMDWRAASKCGVLSFLMASKTCGVGDSARSLSSAGSQASLVVPVVWVARMVNATVRTSAEV